MESYGWLSLLPPIIAIGVAIKTRQVYLSLGLYVLLGWTIMSGGNPVTGAIQSLDTFIAAVTDPGNARTLLFSALIGAMITFTQASGGMDAFVDWAEHRGFARSKRSVGMLTIMVSMGVFLESNFGLLVSGSVARPLFDKCRISREKLSYLIDATCAPKCILIPLNAWGAYVIGLLLAQDVANPTRLIVAALPLNFYAILAILLAVAVVLFDWNIGQMRTAEDRVAREGKLLRDGAIPMVSQEVSTIEAKSGVPKRVGNMVIPILTMILVVPAVLYITGDGNIMNGSGSHAVLWGVVLGLLAAAVLYLVQGIMNLQELSDHTIRGIQGLTPLVIVLALAFTIAATTKPLGTGIYLASVVQGTIHPGLVPSLVFLMACFVAFSTGTSWGTFAIMIPIVIPMIEVLGLHPALTVAAALGGGIFGDHCSPISDSTIVASMAAATDHIDHVRTQLPYALIAASGALTLFLIFGFVL